MKAAVHAAALLALGAAPGLRAAAVADDVVVKALSDELQRSLAELHVAGGAAPYFIAYRVEERRAQRVSATFGGAYGRSDTKSRSLRVELRLGSPAFDNTNFLPAGVYSVTDGTVTADLPTDDDYTELRRQVWLATDRAYKKAVENLARKKAALENKTRTDETPDFSPQEALKSEDLRPPAQLDLAQAEGLARELSAVFREAPALATSLVSVSGTDELTRYVNSEGTSFARRGFLVGLEVTARTQAADGFGLADHRLWYRRAWDELPPRVELVASVRELCASLSALRDAPLAETYNGPVLFDDEAAAEIFAQVFAPRLAARKRAVGETAQMETYASALENPFVDKLGARVLSELLSVSDEPLLTQLGREPLAGSVRVDDEGVPTRAVRLVEEGRLKTLLVSRSPVRLVPRSSGSQQGSGPMPHNLVVSTSRGQDAAGLKAQLLELARLRGKDYGVRVRRIANPIVGAVRDAPRSAPADGVRVEPVIQAYKVYLDGREELVRNAEIAGMSALLFKDVLAAGREPCVYSAPFRTTESPDLQVVSFAVPALLFEDVTLRRPSGDVTRPQVAKHPYFDR